MFKKVNSKPLNKTRKKDFAVDFCGCGQIGKNKYVITFMC